MQAKLNACKQSVRSLGDPLPDENIAKLDWVWTPLRDSRLILLNITPHFDYFSADKKEHEYGKKRHALQSHVTSSYRHSTLTMLIKCHSLVKTANQHGHGTQNVTSYRAYTVEHCGWAMVRKLFQNRSLSTCDPQPYVLSIYKHNLTRCDLLQFVTHSLKRFKDIILMKLNHKISISL